MSKFIVQPRSTSTNTSSFPTLEAAIRHTQGKGGVHEILEVTSHLVIASQDYTPPARPTIKNPQEMSRTAPFGLDANGKAIAKYGYKKDGSIKRMPGRKFNKVKRTAKPYAPKPPYQAPTITTVPVAELPAETLSNLDFTNTIGNGQPTS